MEPDLCARPSTKDDAAVLIGVLAVLQGHALAGDLDCRTVMPRIVRAAGPPGVATPRPLRATEEFTMDSADAAETIAP